MSSKKLHICTYGDPVLRKKSIPISKISDEVRKLALDMIDSMIKNEGIGLAAPQVGFNVRLVTIDVRTGDSKIPQNASPGERLLLDQMPIALVNPRITRKSDNLSQMSEGCLSIPEINADVVRPSTITLECDIIIQKGRENVLRHIKMDCSGLLGICIQHEVDHLNGFLFIDRLSKEDKAKLLKRLKKMERKTIKALKK